jgi:uncharacterized RDD family membrane protein YckC
MRCPKCHYLSFDPEPRCKNCGYGFSPEDDDLLIRDEREEENLRPSPFADVNLRAGAIEPAMPRPPHPTESPANSPVRATSAFASLVGASDLPITGDVTPAERAAVNLPPSPSRSRPAPTTELPLFVKGMSGAAAAPARILADEPLVQLSEEPRPPLSVRRKIQDPPAPKPARPAAVPESKAKGPLDRDLLGDLREPDALSAPESRARRGSATVPTPGPVGAGRRLGAAVIDGALLGSLSVAVMWLTLRWCGLSLDRALMLPVLVPTSAFLSLLGVGSLLMFTAAGGQTIGKMAVGLRVVREITPFDAGGPVSFGQAMLRALLTLPSVLVAGVGFLPALLGEERAVHDRLAHTRVIRA